MWAGRLPEREEDFKDMALDLGISLGRFAESHENANLVVFLASDHACIGIRPDVVG
jgi:hypothetical protein